MIDPESAPAFPALTAEHITTITGYRLVATYEEHTYRDVTASQKFRDHVTQLEGAHHKINVMSTLFVDDESHIKLGIFVRRQSRNHSQEANAKTGSLAMLGVSTTSIHGTGRSIERNP